MDRRPMRLRGTGVSLVLALVLASGCGASQHASRNRAGSRTPTTVTTSTTTTTTTAAPAGPGRTNTLALGGDAVALGSGSVWVGRQALGASLRGEVLRIDPVTLAVQARIPVPVPPRVIAVSGATVWVAGGGDGALPVGAVVSLDARTGKLLRRYGPTATPWSPVGIAIGSNAVWVADNSRSMVLRIDPVSGRVTGIRIGTHPTSIAVKGSDVWVGSDGTVWHVDANTNAARATFVAGVDVVIGNPYVWVSSISQTTGDTTTLDPQGAFLGTSVGTPIRAHFDERSIAGKLAVDGSAVWVAEPHDVVLLRVTDALEAKIVPASYLGLDDRPSDVAAANGTVWIVSGFGAPLVRWHPAI